MVERPSSLTTDALRSGRAVSEIQKNSRCIHECIPLKCLTASSAAVGIAFHIVAVIGWQPGKHERSACCGVVTDWDRKRSELCQRHNLAA